MQDGFGFTPLQAGLGFLPMSLVNFAVALAIPRLSRRIPNAVLLAAGTALTLVGMAWLSRAGIDDSYVLSVAVPMMLIGAARASRSPHSPAPVWPVFPPVTLERPPAS